MFCGEPRSTIQIRNPLPTSRSVEIVHSNFSLGWAETCENEGRYLLALRNVLIQRGIRFAPRSRCLRLSHNWSPFETST